MREMIARRLREVTVRPTEGAGERRRWDALMAARHDLPFRGLVGRSVRHVAVLGEHSLALISPAPSHQQPCPGSPSPIPHAKQ